VLLKTADQYDIWKARVTDACWAATTRNVFNVTDEDCTRGLDAFVEAKEGVDKCWPAAYHSQMTSADCRGFRAHILFYVSHWLPGCLVLLNCVFPGGLGRGKRFSPIFTLQA